MWFKKYAVVEGYTVRKISREEIELSKDDVRIIVGAETLPYGAAVAIFEDQVFQNCNDLNITKEETIEVARRDLLELGHTVEVN